ncbi:MAG: hypothetical protein M3Y04_02815 [Actinomycetota bacterium]|nr:hypothetical protein [Actinomycetota bacterium]
MDVDYGAGYGVQRGLAVIADQAFVFGRNEPGAQHSHRTIKDQMARAAAGRS